MGALRSKKGYKVRKPAEQWIDEIESEQICSDHSLSIWQSLYKLYKSERTTIRSMTCSSKIITTREHKNDAAERLDYNYDQNQCGQSSRIGIYRPKQDMSELKSIQFRGGSPPEY